MVKGTRRVGGWTVWLIPDDPAQEAMRLHIPRRAISVVLGFAVLLAGWLIFITTHYFWLYRSHERLAQIQIEYERAKDNFKKIQKYSYKLQSELDRMERQIRQMQVMAGVLTGDNILQIVGVGGKSVHRSSQLTRASVLEQQWFLAQSHRHAKSLQRELDRLYEVFHQKSVALSATPSIRPVRGYIISGYGRRRDPFTGAPGFHAGVDIYAPYGAPVVATASGRVVFTGRKGTYGKLVVINHGFGVFTYYGHLAKILVRRGQTVQRWQIIGLVGSSGRSTGPHVHYEIRYQNQPLNPLYFIIDVF